MIYKTCTKCKKTKTLDEFYKNPSGESGRMQPCKRCRSKQNKESYRMNPDKFIKRVMHYQKTHPQKVYEQIKKLNFKYPEKSRARGAINYAVIKKELPPASSLKCIRCNGNAKDYHHHKGYEKSHWLDVVPVCRKCHNILDRNH